MARKRDKALQAKKPRWAKVLLGCVAAVMIITAVQQNAERTDVADPLAAYKVDAANPVALYEEGGSDVQSVTAPQSGEALRGASPDPTQAVKLPDPPADVVSDSPEAAPAEQPESLQEDTRIIEGGIRAAGLFSGDVLEDGSYGYRDERGVYRWTVTNGILQSDVEIQFMDGIRYRGEAQGERVTGQGTIWYPNGDVYVGTVEDGLKSGRGVYTWADCARYDGEWSEDRLEGQGVYYYSAASDTQRLDGAFADNRPNGESIYYAPDGKSYSTTWKKGVCTDVRVR